MPRNYLKLGRLRGGSVSPISGSMKAIGAGLCVFVMGLALLSPVGAGSCYEIYGQVRNLGMGWAHIVVVENDCDYWLQCTVWTDVDPQPPAMMTVGPGMSEKAQITGDSKEREFKAFGTCHRK